MKKWLTFFLICSAVRISANEPKQWLPVADDFTWPTEDAAATRFKPQTVPMAELDAPLREYVKKRSKSDVVIAYIDLNGDAIDEVFFRLDQFSATEPYYVILEKVNDSYLAIGGVANPDNQFLEKKNGWLQINSSFTPKDGQTNRNLLAYEQNRYRIIRSEIHDFNNNEVTIKALDHTARRRPPPAPTTKPTTNNKQVDWLTEIKSILGKNLKYSHRPTKRDWAKTEKAIGKELPADYKELLTYIGAGEFFSDQLFLYLPNKIYPNVDLANRFSLNPKNQQLIQFASSPSAFGWFWKTDGKDPNKWPIVMLDLENDLKIRAEANISVSEFIGRALTKEYGGYELIENYLASQSDHRRFKPIAD